MRQGQGRVGGGDTLDLDEVDVQGAHAPRLGAHAPGRDLQGLADLEQLARGEGRHGRDHRVEVVGLGLGALGDDGDRAGQRRHLRDLDALGGLEALDGRAQGVHDSTDVGAQAEDDAHGTGGPLGERVDRSGRSRRGLRCGGSRCCAGGAQDVGLRRRRGVRALSRLREVLGGGGLGVGGLGVGRCDAFLARGPGELTGDGKGAGPGLAQGLGGRNGGGVHEAVDAGGPRGGVTAQCGEGEAGRVGARRLGGGVPGMTGLAGGGPAVGAGLVEGDGPAQEVRGALDGGSGLVLALLGGGHMAALMGQLDSEVTGGGGRFGRSRCGGVSSHLLGIAEDTGLRLAGGGRRAQGVGRQAHEPVGAGGPAGGGRGGGAGRGGIQRARRGVGTGSLAGGQAGGLLGLGSLRGPGGGR